MRLRHIVGALVFASLTAGAQDRPEATWLSTDHDFGAFSEDSGVATCTFCAVNTGDSPLIVITAQANCGCTTPRYSKEPVAPGDTLVINVGYDPEGRPGRFEKHVTVRTNASDSREKLTIHGTVVGSRSTLGNRYPMEGGDIRMRYNSLLFGNVPKNAVRGEYVEGYNASTDTIAPVVEGCPPYITWLVSPAKVGPGEQFILSATFAGPECPQWDLVTDTLRLTTSRGDVFPLTTVATVEEDFSKLSEERLQRAPRLTLEPASIDLGRISHETLGKRLSQHLTLTNSGKTPLKIRRVYSVDPAVKITKTPDEIKPGKKAKIQVEVTPQSDEPVMLNTRLIVVSNDPQTPRRIVRIVGEVMPDTQP